ncbi:hypothetical protein COE15_06840 [Bacillus cereus]|uniref:hypothetical protein n=1 Tax=Bacillus sp. AFS023182 TaxID=2033492 RepID=UPI000BF571DF|nr:hypothetical protein [Bacillus sp. AFS023182]PFE05069.1 hypothetical protein CN288_05415 [Bacillus sp. AFS023182]PGY02994.1 hypothetical protein COE15_06840 [Bacillus cereus]
MLDIFDVGNWCDVCGKEIKGTEIRTMHIEGCEKTLCSKCNGEMEQSVKVVNFHVLQDAMKELINLFGRDKVQQFDLTAAGQFIKENKIAMQVEKRGGKFNQERLGEFVSLSTAELITIITFLKRKINSHLWMNAVIGAILDQQIVITLEGEKGE